ncbi:MAG: hypothetical protein ACR2HF_06765, partial [Methylococcaceae bacterium]
MPINIMVTDITENTTPITLSLTQNGLSYTSLADSVAYFDFSGDQIPDHTAWVGRGDGFLAYDANHDGRISQRNEIVFTDYAPNAQTDMEAVRWAFDTNGDAWLSPQDKDWASFGVWQDANGNGINDAGEFRSLESWGIARISLQSDGVTTTPVDGVVSHGVSSIEWVDGHTSQAGDVGFGFEPASAVADATTRPLASVADSVNHSLDTALTDTLPQASATPTATVTDPVLADVYARFQQAVMPTTSGLEPHSSPVPVAESTVAATPNRMDDGLAESISRLKEAAARSSTAEASTNPTQEPSRVVTENKPAAPPANPADTNPLSGTAYKNMLLGHDAQTGPITAEQPMSPHVVPTVPDATAASLNWQTPLDDLSHA